MGKVFNLSKWTVNHPSQKLKIWREGDCIFKTSPRLNQEWAEKFKKMLNLWPIPTFIDFYPNGYITQYIDGTDLQGNSSFTMNPKQIETIPLTKFQKSEFNNIFTNAIYVGKKLGYTLGDITCGNIFVKKQDPRNLWLIDYDVIVPYPIDSIYEQVWNNTRSLVKKHDKS